MRLATDASTARLSGRFHARRIAWVRGREPGGGLPSMRWHRLGSAAAFVGEGWVL